MISTQRCRIRLRSSRRRPDGPCSALSPTARRTGGARTSCGAKNARRARAAGVTPRTLRQADFLLGVRDDVRQGAIRFRRPGTEAYYSSHPGAVPRLLQMPRLLHAVDQLDAEGTMDRDLKDLIDAGSSLGGARPKAAVVDASGRLAIAKFPRSGSDDWDMPGWEKLELDLAERAGLNAARSDLAQAGGRHGRRRVAASIAATGCAPGSPAHSPCLRPQMASSGVDLEILVIERHSSRAAADSASSTAGSSSRS